MFSRKGLLVAIIKTLPTATMMNTKGVEKIKITKLGSSHFVQNSREEAIELAIGSPKLYTFTVRFQ
jgi:hypothetical protein